MLSPDNNKDFEQLSVRYRAEWLDLQKRLIQSKFRSHFQLKEKEIRIFLEKGTQQIFAESKQILRQRLAPAFPRNDGKQTPMKAYPVFIAQHACGICCRSCLLKWHYIPMNRNLTEEEITKLAWFITAWIRQKSENHRDIRFTPDLF